jgi:tRNA 2-thiouridine synthesizing protein B
MNTKEIFLLTKPPHSDRTRLCFQLMEHSENAVLYLAGDGVYFLLDAASLKALPKECIMVCKEDLQARGVQAEGMATVLEDFYELLVKEMTLDDSRIYTF